jgi:hypothetical protein
MAVEVILKDGATLGSWILATRRLDTAGAKGIEEDGIVTSWWVNNAGM